LLDPGADLRTLPGLLAPADIRTTARYLHVSLRRIQAAASPFDTLTLPLIDPSEDHARPR
jgi:site-specific recombinase XerD